jgi:hypothetical protein
MAVTGRATGELVSVSCESVAHDHAGGVEARPVW